MELLLISYGVFEFFELYIRRLKLSLLDITIRIGFIRISFQGKWLTSLRLYSRYLNDCLNKISKVV